MKSGRERGRYHHGDLRTSLIEAASALLEKSGPEAISFRAVARAAGVSQTAPYNHFASREDLLATLAEAGFRLLETSQNTIRAGDKAPRRAIVEMGLDYVRFASGNPQLYRLMFGGFVGDWHVYPGASEAKAATFEPITAILTEHLSAHGAVTSEAVKTAAIACWSMVHGMAMLRIDRRPHFRDDGDIVSDELIAQVLELLLRGFESAAREAVEPSSSR